MIPRQLQFGVFFPKEFPNKWKMCWQRVSRACQKCVFQSPLKAAPLQRGDTDLEPLPFVTRARRAVDNVLTAFAG